MSAVAAPNSAFEDTANSWEQLRADEDIQFAPIEIPVEPPSEPNFIERFFRWLGEIIADLFGPLLINSWPILKWILLATLIATVLYMLYQIFDPLQRIKRAQPELEEAPDWRPEESAVVALLEDADRLAAAGKYDEATHLLLQRSVHQMSSARPDWVEPSSTARELTRLEGLPDAARQAFSVMAERVEQSLFALTHLDRGDWEAARGAYARFALSHFDKGAG